MADHAIAKGQYWSHINCYRPLDTAYRADVAGAQTGEQLTAVNFALIWEAREAAMFENLTWALRQEGPSGRLMLWAHDAHIAKGSLPSARVDLVGLLERERFGLLIEKALGEDYFTIGTTFYEGKPGWQNAREGAACGTVGGELARLSGSAFSLDIRSNKKDTASLAWLDKPRIMPADTQAAEYRVVPSQAWDAIVFIRHITPVRVVSTN
jgi:erythromycin esterase-like protein